MNLNLSIWGWVWRVGRRQSWMIVNWLIVTTGSWQHRQLWHTWQWVSCSRWRVRGVLLDIFSICCSVCEKILWCEDGVRGHVSWADQRQCPGEVLIPAWRGTMSDQWGSVTPAPALVMGNMEPWWTLSRTSLQQIQTFLLKIRFWDGSGLLLIYFFRYVTMWSFNHVIPEHTTKQNTFFFIMTLFLQSRCCEYHLSKSK